MIMVLAAVAAVMVLVYVVATKKLPRNRLRVFTASWWTAWVLFLAAGYWFTYHYQPPRYFMAVRAGEVQKRIPESVFSVNEPIMFLAGGRGLASKPMRLEYHVNGAKLAATNTNTSPAKGAAAWQFSAGSPGRVTARLFVDEVLQDEITIQVRN